MPPSPSRILHIIPSLAVGGAEILLLRSIQLLPEYEHHVLSFGGEPEVIRQFENVAVVHLKKSKRVLSFSNLLFARRLEKKIKPYVIHAHLLTANWLSRLAFATQNNLVNSIHSPYGKDAFSIHMYSLWVEKLSYYLSRATLVFVSDYVQEDYSSFIRLRDKTFILYNFVSEEFLKVRPKQYIPGQPLYLVAVGNVKPLKNYGLLIEVFKKLGNIPVYLDVYGSGSLVEGFVEKVKKHSLKINFKGSGYSIESVLPGYHAFLFPSLYEGFSIALLEAMAAEMPLILSDIPMFRKLANGYAYYFDPKDEDNCLQAINKAFTEGFPASYVRYNKQFVLEHFTGEIYKQKLLNIYQLCNPTHE